MRTLYIAIADKLERYFRIDARYFLSGGFWLGSSQVLTAILGLLTTALLANYLTENQFGNYKYLVSIAILISSFSLSGMGAAIVQSATKGYNNFTNETLLLRFKYNIVVVLIGLIAAVYYHLNNNELLALGCLLIATIHPFINSLQFAPNFLSGKKDFKKSSQLLVLKSLLISSFLLLALFFFENVLLLFLFYLLGNLVFAVSSYFLICHKKTNSPTPESAYARFVLYAKHTSVRNIASNIAFRIDNILVFTQLGAIDLAIYSIANALPEHIKGFFKKINSLLLPKFANENTYEIAKKGIPKRSLQFLIVLVAISLAYCLAAPLIFEILFPKYTEAIIYSQLFALIFPAYIYYLPLTALMSELDETKLYKFHIFTSIFQLIITLVLIWSLQLLGAVLARLITQYLRSAYCYYIAMKS